MYWFGGVENFGISGDFIVITSPPMLRSELCIFDTYVYCIIDPQCAWSWLWSLSCCRSTMYVWWLHSSWFIFIMDPHYISYGHDLICWVLHRSAVYFWKLCLVVISKYVWQLARGFFGTGLMVVAPRHPLPPPPRWQYYCIKYFGHHTYLLTSHFRGHLLHSKMPPLHRKMGWNATTYLSPWKICPKDCQRYLSGFDQCYQCVLSVYHLHWQCVLSVHHSRWSRNPIFG